MAYYIALIHKEGDSCYGASFPDVPGVIAAGDSIDEAIRKAGEALAFAAEDWKAVSGRDFPTPRMIDELREVPEFLDDSDGAIIAAVPLSADIHEAA